MENLRLEAAQKPEGLDAWQRVLSVLESRLPPHNFDTWFRPTTLLSHSGRRLDVRVPNEMAREWLKSRYVDDVRQAAEHAGLGGYEVVYVTPESETSALPRQESREAPPAERRSLDYPPPPVSSHQTRSRLNRRYTFENFVVSSCNQFAHAACLAVADQVGRAYNPLFIYGGVGLGKTHLMQAIGNRLAQRTDAGARVHYTPAVEFMNELIEAIRYERTPEFRERYRSVDVLLIDDIQFIAGRESTQEEFFHTFNALYDGLKQIVFTADCPPRKIPSIEERLRSRFEWGLIADISPPDLETKIAIIEKIACSEGWDLASEVSLYIAANIQSNIRELEGCLKTLMAACSLQRRKPDLELAREVLRTLMPQEKPLIGMESIAKVVAGHFGLRVMDLKSKTNARKIVGPRQIAMYLSKKISEEGLVQIGRFYGGKHHTTVLHSIRTVERKLRADRVFANEVTAVEEQLR